MGMEFHFNIYYTCLRAHACAHTHTTVFYLPQRDHKDLATSTVAYTLTAELVAMPIELLVRPGGELGGDGAQWSKQAKLFNCTYSSLKWNNRVLISPARALIKAHSSLASGANTIQAV